MNEVDGREEEERKRRTEDREEEIRREKIDEDGKGRGDRRERRGGEYKI